MASSSSGPSGLQVHVLFKALWSHLYGAFRGGRSGLFPVLGCLSSRGPLGLSLALYRARVQHLDIACFDCKVELVATSLQLQERSPNTLPLLRLSPQ